MGEACISRENLILVHSFPTNSILLRGLTEYLQDHFVVHFVDLPGFTREVPPLRPVSIEGFAAFLSERIRALGLETYILGGISFGFLIACNATLTPGCRAIFAMEPFLGERSLIMKPWARAVVRSAAALVRGLGLADRIFHSERWRQRLLRRGEPRERVETLIREVDAGTFFGTAEAVLGYRRDVRFHDLPHVLLLNPQDGTINAENVAEVFRKEVRDLLVVETTVDHYPKELTKAYFEERIPAGQVDSILTFLAAAEARKTDRSSAARATPAEG